MIMLNTAIWVDDDRCSGDEARIDLGAQLIMMDV